MSVSHARASEELARRDPVMRELFRRHGPMRLASAPRADRRFEALATAIASQQLNGRAAASIWARVRDRIEGPFVAEAVLDVPMQEWRTAGLSGAKAASLVDLAAHVASGRLRLERIGRCDDATIIERLTAVRGIGPWTAQMFLMFSLRRLDVWPTGDFGVRSGYGRAFSGGSMPSTREMEALGDRFRPYRSVAAWYCWAAADDPDFTPP